MTLAKCKSKVIKDTKEGGDMDLGGIEDEHGHKNLKEGAASTNWRSHTAQSSDTAGALRKSHYSNRSNNMDGSSEHTSDGDTAAADEDGGKLLVIPEKASSFSIHPGRLCKDECSYCFGKFGLFDTPCHIAQMKSFERQEKILKSEKHLTRDSCLCDACYRHVDRKSNTPSYSNKGSKRSNIVAPGPRQNHCHVLGCSQAATDVFRRKWLIKIKKNVCEVVNIDLNNPGLHSIPLCDQHYAAVDVLMVCSMCKRKLARNHIYYLGSEINDVTKALNEERIPVKLEDKPIVCKFCRIFSSIVLKSEEERVGIENEFFTKYRKKLLHFHDIERMDDTEAEEPIPVPTRERLEREPIRRKKKIQKSSNSGGPPVLEPQVDLDKNDQSRVPSDSNSTSKSRSESPSDYMVDYHTLIPSIAMECGSDAEAPKREVPKTVVHPVKKHTLRPESIIKEAVEISKTMKVKNNCDSISRNSAIAVQRLGSNPCISVRQLFPGEEELGLQGNIEFGNVKEKNS
ncbi:hypothetical protein ILUMI_24847 [Ignelater luminosus]|uniref:Uncharacterized protein n=1 Tax=Ignelater luminosus TaxID=2038154 RepID=A0A8K0C9H6_IGNLU|nr:hypothetical protein ILUMI_24847 [Ignelater luminosus]